MQRILNPDTYCLLFDIPKAYYVKADMALATVLASSFAWVPYVNDSLTMLGLGLGVFIAAVRAVKTWRFRNTKD